MKAINYFDRYKITEDSFGDYLPVNWQKIAVYLNKKIETKLRKMGDAEEWEVQDAVNEIWDAYCDGKWDRAPKPVYL